MLPNTLLPSILLLLLLIQISAQCGPGSIYDEERNKCSYYLCPGCDEDNDDNTCKSSQTDSLDQKRSFERIKMASELNKMIDEEKRTEKKIKKRFEYWRRSDRK
ncbi:unnamed protein product [Caenorhabditis sp. 36 PRJEB53466]|nr:unnamed protein product [Caenorhabditis sp. 36 PRJEB53466]